MSQRLDAGMPGNRRRGLLIWWLFGAAAVIVLVVAGLLLRNRSQANDPAEPSASIHFPVTNASEIEESARAEQGFELPKSSNTPTVLSATEKTNQIAHSKRASQDPAAEPTPSATTEFHGSTEIDSDKKTSFSPLYTAPGLNPSDTRIHISAISLPGLGLSALSMPNTSDLLLSAKIKSPQSTEVESTKKTVRKGYFIDLSAGMRTARPNSYVAQTGLGWRTPISDRWGILINTGLGINGMHQPAQVALKELQSNSEFRLDGSTANPSNEFSEITEVPVAELQLKNNYFAYLGAHLSYSIHERWSLNMGLEAAFRFHSVHEDPMQLNPGIIASPNGGASQFNFNSRQIENRFLLFNRWDIRPVAGLSYALRPGIQLEASYRHGLIPLLAHPTKDTPPGSARFLQLGIRYQIGG